MRLAKLAIGAPEEFPWLTGHGHCFFVEYYRIQGSNQCELTIDKLCMHWPTESHSHKMVISWRLQLQIDDFNEYLLDASHYFHGSYSAATNTPGLEPGHDLEEVVPERASFKRIGGCQLILNQLGNPLSCLLVKLRVESSLPQA